METEPEMEIERVINAFRMLKPLIENGVARWKESRRRSLEGESAAQGTGG